MFRLTCLLAALLATLLMNTNADYEVKPVQLSLLSPQGIRFQYPDEPGITLVAYHYSVNKPLSGVNVGDWNVDVISKTGDFWIHDNTQVSLQLGDVVNYWVYVVYNGIGYQMLELSWTVTDQTPVSTETPPVTNSPATEARTNAPVTNPPATNPPVTNPAVTPSAGGTELPGTTRNSGGGGGIPSQCSMYPCDLSCDMSIAPCNGLIFQEEFDTLNLDIWQHEITAGGGGNWEFQYYTNNRSNSYVKDGKLYLKPTFTEDKLGEGSLESGTLDLWGASPSNLCTGNAWYGCERRGTATGILNPIQSARIRTVESFSFKYGRLEVEAKLPTGDWLWPAIWLLPKHNVYGDWPASGEIDLMESRGNLDLVDGEGVQAGVNQMGSTMHWGPFWPQNGWPKTHNTKNLPEGETFGDTFHKYRLDWTEEYMKFYVDDELLLTVDPSSGFWDLGEFEEAAPGVDNPWQYNPNKLTPFDQEFYLILNVAVGGTNYFGDGLTNSPSPKPWTNDSPQASKDFWDARADWMPTWQGEEAAMQVNYIRVYAEPGQTTYHLRDR